MALRPCLDCGTLTPRTRCPTCTAPIAAVYAQRKRERRPERSHTERQRRADTVTAWRDTYGDVCPGWNRTAHAATDLTADHVLPVAAGGAEDGPLTILCRECNGRKADRASEG